MGYLLVVRLDLKFYLLRVLLIVPVNSNFYGTVNLKEGSFSLEV